MGDHLSLDDFAEGHTVVIEFNGFAFSTTAALAKRGSGLLKNVLEGDGASGPISLKLPSDNEEHYLSLILYLRCGIWQSPVSVKDVSAFPHVYANANYLNCTEVLRSLDAFVHENNGAIINIVDIPETV